MEKEKTWKVSVCAEVTAITGVLPAARLHVSGRERDSGALPEKKEGGTRRGGAQQERNSTKRRRRTLKGKEGGKSWAFEVLSPILSCPFTL